MAEGLFSLSLWEGFWVILQWRAEIWRHLKGLLRIWRKGWRWKLQMKLFLLCGASFVIYLHSLCFFFSALPKVKLCLSFQLFHILYVFWFYSFRVKQEQEQKPNQTNQFYKEKKNQWVGFIWFSVFYILFQNFIFVW